MKEQLSVVSKKVSDLILENHPSYAAELQKVTELQKLLLQAYDVCYRARRYKILPYQLPMKQKQILAIFKVLRMKLPLLD